MAAQNVQSRCMPVTAASFTAEAVDSAEEVFSGVIRLSDYLARLDSPRGGRAPSKTVHTR
jgi:hypothetical protein